MSVNRREALAAITQRITDDPAYRQRLLDDPRAAVGEALGVNIPDTVRITVLEDSLTQVHLVLPAADNSPLTDADLELVAGGTWVDDPPYNPYDNPYGQRR